VDGVKYYQAYDELRDESFQIEVTDEQASRMTGLILDEPSSLPIKSRYRSERHTPCPPGQCADPDCCQCGRL
jgi:hypothetical protein